MAGVLLSGPAGAGKSQTAQQILSETSQAIVVDFQSLYAALLQLVRLPNGRFPERLDSDAYALAATEYLRRAAITAAQQRELYTIVTNSDGSPARRQQLLGLLGPDAVERVIDPGKAVVTARLADTVTGELSQQCASAIDRWYGRLESRDSEIREAIAGRTPETFQIEIRQEANELRGVLIQEGRAASGGRKEVWIPGAVEWLDSGVEILPEHKGTVETRAIPERQADGRITVVAALTDRLRNAWNAGRKFLSVEFHALEERTVRGGVREVQRALVTAGALVPNPEYDVATTELRETDTPESEDLYRWL